jgi:hypothetical protein
MSVRDAVDTALAAEPAGQRDVATAELARTYATLIDQAAPAAKYTKALDWLTRAAADDEDDDAGRHIDTIRVALAAHSVASDLGPKLLAALEALLLSPRARGVAMKGGTDGKPAASPLDELAARRAGIGCPPAVHPTTEGLV